jgi:hypothetical protein
MLEILSVLDISSEYILLREFPMSWAFLSRTNEAGTLVMSSGRPEKRQWMGTVEFSILL